MGLLVVLALRSQLRQRYVETGLWAGIAAALRPQGMLLGAALIDGWLRGRWLRPTLGMLLSGLGIALYAGWLWWHFGNPFYFAELQKGLRPHWSVYPWDWAATLIAESLMSVMLLLGDHPAYRVLSCRIVDPFVACWAIFRLPSVRRVSWGWMFVAALMIAMPLSTGTSASMCRYVWAIVPIFMVMAEDYCHSRLRWPVAAGSLAIGLWLAFLFGGGWIVI